MTEKIYYIERNGMDINKMLLEGLFMKIPCFIQTEPIEMDYVKIILQVRVEDLRTVENFMADLV